jgi:hypothetical protein
MQIRAKHKPQRDHRVIDVTAACGLMQSISLSLEQLRQAIDREEAEKRLLLFCDKDLF